LQCSASTSAILRQLTIQLPIGVGQRKVRAEPILSNIRIVESGTAYTLTGDVTNAGLEPANAVVITMGEGAVPEDPYRQYAVGTLQPDDFSGFELTFSVEGDKVSVPVVITHKDSDGNLYTTTVPVDIPASSVRNTTEKETNGPSLPVVGVIVACAAVIGGIVWYSWRKEISEPPGHDPIIVFRDVVKIYPLPAGDVLALDRISISVEPGDFIAIMGPSGSGKSSLLNLMGCLDTPTSGYLEIRGRDISSMSDDELTLLRRDHIGFIFQQFNLIPLLSALENVQYPLILKTGNRECVEQCIKLLEAMELDPALFMHKPAELSGDSSNASQSPGLLSTIPRSCSQTSPPGTSTPRRDRRSWIS